MTHKLLSTFVVVVAVVGLAGHAWAALTWENPVQEFWPRAGGTEQVVSYRFENTGDETIRIKSVKSDCGCTTPTFDQSEYEPGESGKITATFTFGQRQGKQIKNITVETDDPVEPVQQLTMVVFIPDAVQVSPNLLLWYVDDVPTTKEMMVDLIAEEPSQLIEVFVEEEAPFEVSYEPVEIGKRYRVTVTPVALTRRTTTSVYLRVKFIQGDMRVFKAYLLIKPRPE